jgi:hypothetical protein
VSVAAAVVLEEGPLAVGSGDVSCVLGDSCVFVGEVVIECFTFVVDINVVVDSNNEAGVADVNVVASEVVDVVCADVLSDTGFKVDKVCSVVVFSTSGSVDDFTVAVVVVSPGFAIK